MYGETVPEHKPCASGYIDARDGVKLYHEIYDTEESAPAVLGIVHGYADHHARYEYLLRYFHERQLSIALFDYRGHGQSGGKRGHCYVFEEFHRDLAAFLKALRSHAGDRPLFLLGHSHGALIALHYAIARGGSVAGVSGLVTSAPFLGLALEVAQWKLLLGRAISNIWPTFAMPNEIDSALLSHDPQSVAKHAADPVIYRRATARWFTEASRAQREVLARAATLTTPILVLLPTDDRIVDAELSRRFFEQVGSQDKELVAFPGLYHELHNELDRDQVFGVLESWIQARTG